MMLDVVKCIEVLAILSSNVRFRYVMLPQTISCALSACYWRVL